VIAPRGAQGLDRAIAARRRNDRTRRREEADVDEREAAWAAAMRAASRGDAAAYERFLREVAAALRRVVGRRLGGLGLAAHEAEDVVQEALLGLHLKRGTWDEARPILPWVHAIARHKLLDAARRRRKGGRPAVELPIEDWVETIAAPAAEPDLASRDAERAIAALPPGQRVVVNAIAVGGLSTREAAEALSMTEGAVRVALHRGLATLARRAEAMARGERNDAD
jgi:RNA polymerase sigma-70 factor (ECF subfamily)